jgi:integrase
MSADIVKHHVERAARRAQIAQSGVHQLRHTFCSHLAMRGAPARAIEFAGHQKFSTGQSYVHLIPAALDMRPVARCPGMRRGLETCWRRGKANQPISRSHRDLSR